MMINLSQDYAWFGVGGEVISPNLTSGETAIRFMVAEYEGVL